MRTQFGERIVLSCKIAARTNELLKPAFFPQIKAILRAIK